MVVNLQGDLPTIAPQAVRAAVAPLADPDVDIATLATPKSAAPRSATIPTSSRRSAAKSAPGRLRALYFTRCSRAVGRGAAAAPHRPLRLPPRRAGALRRPAALAAGAARAARAIAGAGGGHAHRHRAGRRRPARRRHAGRLAPRPRNAGAEKEHHDRQDHRLSGRAGRQFAHRLPPTTIPTIEPLACADVRGRVRRAAGRQRRSGDDPDREFDRRPGRRHSRAAAGLRPAHHRRDLPADPLPVARRARRDAGDPAHRPQPRPRARPVPQDHPQARPDAGRRRRHRGVGARSGGSARPSAAPRSPPSSPARSMA